MRACRRLLVTALGAALGWLLIRGGPDPRNWRGVVEGEADGIRSALDEALAAGKAAMTRREEELLRELQEPSGR